MKHTTSLAVLGEGAWGTTIASMLADKGYPVYLWCHDPAIARMLEKTGRNTTYLPAFTLDMTHIIPDTNLADALKAEYIFVTTPVSYLENILTQCAPYTTADKIWTFLCKGIERENGLLPTQLAQRILNIEATQIFALSGPSFAHDLMLKQPTGAVLAGIQQHKQLYDVLACPYFIIEKSTDLIGIQVAGAFKNVIALLMGILDGAGYYDNTKALAFYKSLAVMQILIEQYGGKKETCWSLAGIGDAVLTAWGKKSRNFIIGKEIGTG
ncbi:MAG: 2-dehydropantoate 2-reductase N-terminal domain-containing protein, partial [Candidatus Babeliaceae bacterium]